MAAILSEPKHLVLINKQLKLGGGQSIVVAVLEYRQVEQFALAVKQVNGSGGGIVGNTLEQQNAGRHFNPAHCNGGPDRQKHFDDVLNVGVLGKPKLVRSKQRFKT